MSKSLHIRDERDVARARQFVIDQCHASGLMWLCDDAALLTSEVVTNAVRHARPGAVSVSAGRDGDNFVVQVLDGSHAEPQVLDPDPWAERGRGMALVNSIAQAWGVVPHPSGKVVWFRL
jgi:anti-sigma regulatory factor (Ser/Thr protein kinase)